MLADAVLTAGGLFNRMRRALTDAGFATPALDARLLLLHILQISHEQLAGHPDQPVDGALAQKADAALTRRLAHEPVSRIIGEREFYGRTFAISPDVLDPRADTETLIDTALTAAHLIPARPQPHRLIDIGTGSGAIAVTLLAELLGWQGIATDISPAALEIARRNATANGVAKRLDTLVTSWLDGLDTGAGADLIVSNPPYIASSDIAGLARDVRDYDPLLALDGGNDGLDAYRAIIPAAFAHLRSGGFALLEAGAGQCEDIWQIMQASGFEIHAQASHIRRDLSGQPRVLCGYKP